MSLLPVLLLVSLFLSVSGLSTVPAGADAGSEKRRINSDNDRQLEGAPHEKKRLDFWSKRWKDNNTNWHRSYVHPALVQFGHLVDLSVKSEEGNSDETTCAASDAAELQVLVPLCGKMVDMAHLAGHANVSVVVGVDGIAKPLEAFAEEHAHLTILPEDEQSPSDPNEESAAFRKWRGHKIELWQGDFFEFPAGADIVFDVVYDRAAMVAIDPSLRPHYVDVLGKVLRPQTGKMLLVAIERVDNLDKGPPYHLSHQAIQALFAPQPWVKSILPLVDQAVPDPGDEGNPFTSKYYLIQAR